MFLRPASIVGQGGNAFFAVLVLLTGIAPEAAKGDIITQNLAGTGATIFFPGQSLTTPSGGPWDNVMFNFFLDVSATTPTAAGTLFLFSQEYLGTPAALNSSAPGFLAQSQSISSGMYLFDPSVTLLPNTQYFFYANASFFLSGGNDAPGGSVYFSFSATTPFATNPTQDVNYRLSGTVVPGGGVGVVPEPASLALWALGALGILGYGWRRRMPGKPKVVTVELAAAADRAAFRSFA